MGAALVSSRAVVEVDAEDAKPETPEVGTSTGFVYSDADDDNVAAVNQVAGSLGSGLTTFN